MKKPFQVGDRVAVYNGYGRSPGRITDIKPDGKLGVDFPDGNYCVVHSKQCRRLVKRKRREIWIYSNAVADGQRVTIHFAEPSDNYTRFIEAPKGKK